METQNANSKSFSINQLEEPKDIQDIVFNLMANPNLAPINYFNDFSGDLGIDDDSDDSGIFENEDGSLTTMTTHAYHHQLSEDPKVATEILISKAFRRMICFGAKPQALTAFLYHVDIADTKGQYVASEAKKGIDNAAKKFNVKVADRKIRFDHFQHSRDVELTLIVTVIGTIENKDRLLTHQFKSKGNNLFVIGESHNDVNASEYLQFYHRIENSSFPVFDIDVEANLHKIMDDLISKNLISSASPVGRGGLFFSLLRAGMPSQLGFDITTDAEIRTDAFLFGESMGRLLVGVEDDKVVDFVEHMRTTGMPFFTLGHITKGEIRIDDKSYGFVNNMNIEE